MEAFTVESPLVNYTDEFIESDYSYQTTRVHKDNGRIKVGFDIFKFFW